MKTTYRPWLKGTVRLCAVAWSNVQMTKPLRLRIALVPKPLWGINLRSKDGLGPWRWKKLRRRLIAEIGDRCVICKSRDRPHVHEIWEYRETPRTGTAKLIDVEIICPDCHDIHHWGRLESLVAVGIIDVKRHKALMRHFRKVNRCAQRTFDTHAARSNRIWRKRSAKRWKVDWGVFRDAVVEAEAARNLWRARQQSKVEQKPRVVSASSLSHEQARIMLEYRAGRDRNAQPQPTPKELLIERYGGFFASETAKQRKARFAEINRLEIDFKSGRVRPDDIERVQRRLCELKGIDFDEYDDPND